MNGVKTCVASLMVSITFLAGLPARADQLSEATAELVEDIRRAERELRNFGAFQEDPAGAYAHLMRMLRRSIEEQFLQDPDYPFLRVLDDWVREGGDNPDQRYLFARIDGEDRYRVWGNVGSAVAVELQLYEGQPWTGKGRSGAYLPFEALQVDAQGDFEVFIGPREDSPSAMVSNPATDTILVRQIYRQWSESAPGHIHIDNLDHLGTAKPPLDAETTALRLRRTGDYLLFSSLAWPAFVERRYLRVQEPNQVSALMDTEQLGGAQGRWMANGVFELQADQALVIEMPPVTARYKAIQLTDLWFASLEYADRVTSLNDSQVVVAEDGKTYYVISPGDPGYPNWLSADAGRRGIFLIRYDGVKDDIEETHWPKSHLVNKAELPGLIPGFTTASPAQRESTLRERRRHVQIRYNR
jgi:hypothetical protein